MDFFISPSFVFYVLRLIYKNIVENKEQNISNLLHIVLKINIYREKVKVLGGFIKNAQ